jgi:23S rRNA pseudouridine1911/1915/1917 synthase
MEALVVRESASWIAAYKPPGLPSAPLRGQGLGGTSLLGLLAQGYPEIMGLPGRQEWEPGLVHRLDTGTSGLVLCARTPEGFRALREAFDSGMALKGYEARCADLRGFPPPFLEGLGERPWAGLFGEGLGIAIRSRFRPFGPGRRKVQPLTPEPVPGARARKEATREVYVTEVASILRLDGGLARVACFLRKGFRHQVRAHLACAGIPIAGDDLYGGPEAGRLWLHAASIEFPDPDSGAMTRIECELK